MQDMVKNLVTEARAARLTMREVVAAVKRAFITASLEENRLNQCRAARDLGMHRNTLGRHIEVLDIDVVSLRKPVASVGVGAVAYSREA